MTPRLNLWLSGRVRAGRGAVELGLTDSGKIGVWFAWIDSDEPRGVGDTATQALEDAMRRDYEVLST